VRLDLHSLLPRFVLVESAKAADSIRAAEVCAGVRSGEIVIFDRAYVDFVHLGLLNEDGVFWVTALLLYVLMRFLCVMSSWSHSFTRLFTLLRAALWRKIDLWDLLRFCGTAGGHFRYLATPQHAYFPGFA